MAIGGAILGGAWLLLAQSSLGGLLGLPPPLWVRRSSYERAIRELPATTFRRGRSCRVSLPPSVSRLTPRGEVFVEPMEDGSRRILFPTWYGRGGDLQGYLHAERPPGRGAPICGVEQAEVRRVGRDWYWVYRRVD